MNDAYIPPHGEQISNAAQEKAHNDVYAAISSFAENIHWSPLSDLEKLELKDKVQEVLNALRERTLTPESAFANAKALLAEKGIQV